MRPRPAERRRESSRRGRYPTVMDPDPTRATEALDRTPGARERAEQGRTEAEAGLGIPLAAALPDEASGRAALAGEARRICEDTEHSGAQHFAAGQRWRDRASWLGLPATVLVAAASAGAGFSALAGGDTRLTAGLAFAVAIVVAVRDFTAADAKAIAHSAKGARYFALRDDARRFANIEATGPRSLDALTDALMALGQRQKVLRDEEPREVAADLREKVRKGIEEGDYRHDVDRH